MFYDSQQELTPLYTNASLYFMNSSVESFSFVLAESKIYGLENIDIGKEYLTLTKKGSIVVKDNDYEKMAYKAIKLFFNMIYLRKQGRSERESLNNFLPQKIGLRYVNLLESLMNGTSNEYFDSEYTKIYK